MRYRIVPIGCQLEGEGIALLEFTTVDDLGHFKILNSLGITVERAVCFIAVGERRIVYRILIVRGNQLATIFRISHVNSYGLSVSIATCIRPVGRCSISLYNLKGVVACCREGQRTEVDRLGVTISKLTIGDLSDTVDRESARGIISIR